jgi:hypothetical protein
MKNFRGLLTGQWPIMILVVIFLTIPLSTFPITGMFEFVLYGLLGLLTVLVIVLLVATLIQALRRDKGESVSNE